MRRTARLAAVAFLAGGAIALTAGTAIAGDEPWPKGSGVTPAFDGGGEADGLAAAYGQGATPAGWLPGYPLNEYVGTLGEEPWPKTSG